LTDLGSGSWSRLEVIAVRMGAAGQKGRQLDRIV
jgi:hypothetical protein